MNGLMGKYPSPEGRSWKHCWDCTFNPEGKSAHVVSKKSVIMNGLRSLN